MTSDTRIIMTGQSLFRYPCYPATGRQKSSLMLVSGGMKDENPYMPASTTPTASGAEEPGHPLLRFIALLFAVSVFGLLFLFAASGVYFTLNPAVLQAGNQPAPASFEPDDFPTLAAWSTAATAFAVALAWCFARTISALPRLLAELASHLKVR